MGPIHFSDNKLHFSDNKLCKFILQNIVIGNFDLSIPTPPGFKTYYIAAMRMIEYSKFDSLCSTTINSCGILK